MLDLSYFQNNGNVNTQTFTNAGYWVTWVKPRGAKFVNIMCIGGGGGAAGGGASGTAAVGGGGGGAGGIVRTQFQASILPDLLYVYTGIGGTGSLGSTTATYNSASNGEKSFVTLIPDTSSISNIVVTSGNVSARGTFSNTAGTGETIATITNAIFLNLGTFIAVAGTAGGIATGAGTAGTITPSQLTTGGGGGGGAGTAGGIVATGPYPSTPSNTGIATTPGTNGANGYTLYKPILGFVGGSGGGGSTAAAGAIGGNGGNGAYGCGGGGGGGARAGGLGGNGGRGGDGLIIITTSF